MRTIDIALSSIFAALYVALVVALAPISFWITQVRIADCLIPLSVVFGWPVIVGVTIGCAAANFVTPLPSVAIDVTLGSVANFLASYGAFKIANIKSRSVRKFLACLFSVFVVTFIVGTYLSWLLGFPLWFGWAMLFVGSFISMCVLGYAAMTTLGRVARLK